VSIFVTENDARKIRQQIACQTPQRHLTGTGFLVPVFGTDFMGINVENRSPSRSGRVVDESAYCGTLENIWHLGAYAVFSAANTSANEL